MLIDDEIEPVLDIGVGEARSPEADESCANIGCAARNIDSRDTIEGDIVKRI